MSVLSMKHVDMYRNWRVSSMTDSQMAFMHRGTDCKKIQWFDLSIYGKRCFAPPE